MDIDANVTTPAGRTLSGALIGTALGTLGGVVATGAAFYGRSLWTIRKQSSAHPKFWRARLAEHDETAHEAADLLNYVVLGDSAASGVGVADPERGYVVHVENELAELTGRPVRTTNLSVPGASSWLLMEHQLPLFDNVQAELRETTGRGADIVTCIIGGNDIIDPNFTLEGFEWTLVRLFAKLPAGTVVSTIPSFGIPPYESRVRAANDLIHAEVIKHDLVLADLYVETRKLWPVKYFFHCSGDFFHPNARGYRLWGDVVWSGVQEAWHFHQETTDQDNAVISSRSSDPAPRP
ncbi:SGNH/GDSL hydrolase family protein [Brevibacterium samyangense]|uniref:SGNH hydrolase-type esterase domain-containing protein n=1 Tax=Brevibacterium samyangense TaxID=366888 RepID=A0ABN2T5K7_9MICO